MGTLHHIKGAGGAMRKAMERRIDGEVAANRSRYHAEMERMGKQLALRRALSRPSVIPLDSSPLARLVRWVRAVLLQLRSPKL